MVCMDPLVCYCLRKRRSEIERCLMDGRAHDLSSLMRRLGVGTVCTSCRHDLAALLKEPRSCEATVASTEETLSYERHPSSRSPYRRLRRFIREWLTAWSGKTVYRGQLVFRQDDGFATSLVIANTGHPSFRAGTIALVLRVECFNAEGQMLSDTIQPLAMHQTLLVRLTDIIGCAGHGLIRVTLRPRFSWQAWRWKIGANRPYLLYERAGHQAVVHEKTVWFERRFVLPGVVSHPARDTYLCLSNVNDRAGELQLTLHSVNGSEQVTLIFPSLGSQLYRLPLHVQGAFIQSVSCEATIACSAYQLSLNHGSEAISLQHLVREGA